MRISLKITQSFVLSATRDIPVFAATSADSDLASLKHIMVNETTLLLDTPPYDESLVHFLYRRITAKVTGKLCPFFQTAVS